MIRENENIFVPGIEITDEFASEREEFEKIWMKHSSKKRRNNRKNTRSRRTQYIFGVDDSVFPPRLTTKTIKH